MRDKTGNGQTVDLAQLLDDLKTVVRDGQDLLRAGTSTLKQRAKVGAERTESMARERPYRTMGVAFGAGIVVGLVVYGLISSSDRD